MSEQPRKRRWFQIHLSTAIILMFAAGGLMWANSIVKTDGMPFESLSSWTERRSYGWPFTGISFLSDTRAAMLGFDDLPATWKGKFDSLMASVDVFIAVNILLTIWFVCEWWIRKRTSRMGNER